MKMCNWKTTVLWTAWLWASAAFPGGSLAADASQEAGSPSPAPEHYEWRNVKIGGGGFVTGIEFHPKAKDVCYARTDVGGAYRWEAAKGSWIPITDWIGLADVNLTGIESLALDVSNPDRVYLAAGTYNRNQAAILCSDDRGMTFRRTNVPFTMGANEAGRGNGERLAVDPNQGEILFFGSRHDGLWKSADRGATWARAESFPVTGNEQSSRQDSTVSTNAPRQGRFGQQPVGVVCVVFDPASGRAGQPTPTLFAAVSTVGTNLFCSTDAGVTWAAVPGQPIGLRPNHAVLARNGFLYLSYGKEPGPNTMTDGAIWKYDLRRRAWTDITPVKPAGSGQPFGYGSVTVDARDPDTLMATTFCHWKEHDEIFRSTNGGASWAQLWQTNTVWDHSSAPYTGSRSPHWMSDIEINPFNSDQVLFTTGYGIWSCVNATAADTGRPTRWVFWNEGLEETVPLALISPPKGAHLVSGIGDIDGFRHDNLLVSQPETFSGPRFANTEDLAFAGQKPEVMARTGTTRGRGSIRAAYSLDGAGTWQAFAREPVPNADAGSIAVSADGRRMVWTPRRSAPHWTLDYGNTWNLCVGLASGVRVVPDPVNPAKFYALDPRAGQFFLSTNGAAHFAAGGALPHAEGFDRGFGGPGGDGARLYAAPEREGDLWLAFREGTLLQSTNAGLSWVERKGIQQALSLGFGKAAPGRSYPALYLAGKVQQLQGLFRSEDAGLTWVRINDDQHQFGWVNHVTGDPRVFGRVYFGTGGRGIIYGDPAKSDL